MDSNKKIIALSGGFDPPTRGQVAMIQEAAELGDVIIILNSRPPAGRRYMYVYVYSTYFSEIGAFIIFNKYYIYILIRFPAPRRFCFLPISDIDLRHAPAA